MFNINQDIVLVQSRSYFLGNPSSICYTNMNIWNVKKWHAVIEKKHYCQYIDFIDIFQMIIIMKVIIDNSESFNSTILEAGDA